jgi:5-methylcytosine-specific restriction protein A
MVKSEIEKLEEELEGIFRKGEKITKKIAVIAKKNNTVTNKRVIAAAKKLQELKDKMLNDELDADLESYEINQKYKKVISNYKQQFENYKVVINVEYIIYKGTGRDIEGPFTNEHTIYFRINKYPTSTINERYVNELQRNIEIVKLLYESNNKYVDHKIISSSKSSINEYNSYYRPVGKRLLRSANVVKYNFTSIDNLNEPEVDGECVQHALIETYGKKIKLNNEILDDYFRKSHDLYCDHRVSYESCISEGGHPFDHILFFLDAFKISYYVLDTWNYVQLKQIHKDSDYKAFIAYIIGNHLYLIDNKKARMSIVARCRDKNGVVKISSKDTDKVEDDSFINRKTLFDVPIEDLVNLENCNVIYNKDSLKDILKDLFIMYKTNYKSSMSNNKVTRITFSKDDEKNVFLYHNPNNIHHVPYDNVKQFADAFNIDFKNESLTSLAIKMFGLFNTKSNINKRMNIKNSIKKQLLIQQENKCNKCDKECIKYEVDHIVRLADGGSNEIENLQILCKECHKNKTDSENINAYFDENQMISNYNSITKHIFSQKKNGFIYGRNTEEELEDGNVLIGGDINKCRRNILYYNQYDFPIFTCLDEPEIYKPEKNIKCGYYYVETNNNLPFKGNGWYAYSLIIYALKEKIIRRSDIKYVLYPSYVLPNIFFKKFIDFILNKQSAELDQSIFKKIFNSFIGSLGTRVDKRMRIFYTFDKSEAAYQAIQWNVTPFYDEKTKIYELVDMSKVETKTENLKPIFNMILDMEAEEVHRLKTILESYKDTEIMYINTDQVICQTPKKQYEYIKEDILKHYWGKDCPKYKIDSNIKHKNNIELKNDNYSFYLKQKKWRIIEDPGYTDEIGCVQFANQLIDMQTSFMLTGPAGSSKTWLTKEIIKILESKNKKVLKMAPTHKATNLIGGITLHNFSYKNIDKSLRGVEYIINDEIGMAKEYFYRDFYYIRSNYPDIKFICVGDFNQLPPVCDFKVFDYKDSSILHEICDNKMVVLSKCRRADDIMFNESNYVLAHGNVKDMSKYGEFMTYKNISFTNKKRIEINTFLMEKRLKELKEKRIILPKNKNDKKSQDILLFKGLPLIACRTEKANSIYNSQSYTVIKFDKSNVIIKSMANKDILTIEKSKLTTLFYPSYCTTTHKSQGDTIDGIYTIWEWEKMTKELRYVALTRGTKMSNINIIGKRDDIKAVEFKKQFMISFD